MGNGGGGVVREQACVCVYMCICVYVDADVNVDLGVGVRVAGTPYLDFMRDFIIIIILGDVQSKWVCFNRF